MSEEKKMDPADIFAKMRLVDLEPLFYLSNFLERRKFYLVKDVVFDPAAVCYLVREGNFFTITPSATKFPKVWQLSFSIADGRYYMLDGCASLCLDSANDSFEYSYTVYTTHSQVMTSISYCSKKPEELKLKIRFECVNLENPRRRNRYGVISSINVSQASAIDLGSEFTLRVSADSSGDSNTELQALFRQVFGFVPIIRSRKPILGGQIIDLGEYWVQDIERYWVIGKKIFLCVNKYRELVRITTMFFHALFRNSIWGNRASLFEDV
jgi:hypothetical protein